MFKKLVGSRWFPTFTKPILAGLLTTSATYILTRLHIVVLPTEVSGIATAVAGFLVTAIVQDPSPKALVDSEKLAEAVVQRLLTKVVVSTPDAVAIRKQQLELAARPSTVMPDSTDAPHQTQ